MDCARKARTYLDMNYLEENRVQLRYHLPLPKIIFDFFDAMKSRTRICSWITNLTIPALGFGQIDILLNGEPCDALSMIVHRIKLCAAGARLPKSLKT